LKVVWAAGDASHQAGGGLSADLQFWFDVQWSARVRRGCTLDPKDPDFVHINCLEFIAVLLQLAACIVVTLATGYADTRCGERIPEIPHLLVLGCIVIILGMVPLAIFLRISGACHYHWSYCTPRSPGIGIRASSSICEYSCALGGLLCRVEQCAGRPCNRAHKTRRCNVGVFPKPVEPVSGPEALSRVFALCNTVALT
jgi:hypothetical protein